MKKEPTPHPRTLSLEERLEQGAACNTDCPLYAAGKCFYFAPSIMRNPAMRLLLPAWVKSRAECPRYQTLA